MNALFSLMWLVGAQQVPYDQIAQTSISVTSSTHIERSVIGEGIKSEILNIEKVTPVAQGVEIQGWSNMSSIILNGYRYSPPQKGAFTVIVPAFPPEPGDKVPDVPTVLNP